MTGTEADIVNSMKGVPADRTAHDTARQVAKLYNTRDRAPRHHRWPAASPWAVPATDGWTTVLPGLGNPYMARPRRKYSRFLTSHQKSSADCCSS